MGHSNAPGDFTRRGRRLVALTIGALAAALLLAVSLIFSSATGAARIAATSRDLQWANTAATAVTVTRVASSQAVVFGIDEALGVADRTAVIAAAAEVVATAELLEDAIATAPSSVAASTRGLLTTVVADAGRIVDLLQEERPVAADRVHTDSLEPAFLAAMADLNVIQSGLASDITASEATAGRVAVTARSVVLVFIPVAAILVYRYLARSELRRRRETMDARLEAAEELGRAKDEFIAGISHELRTPLTSIYGFSQHLLDTGIIDPREAMELIALINDDSAELSRMVEDLLTAARLDSDSLEFTIDAVAVRPEIDAVALPLRRNGHDILASDEDYPVWADRVRLRQIIRNLLSNAARHGGNHIEVSVERVGDEVLVHIADDGPGVPADIESRLFDRFVHDGKATLLTGSVGLGLAISKSLADRMNGTVHHERRGEWTVFTLSLPAAPTELGSEGLMPHNGATGRAAARSDHQLASLSMFAAAGESQPIRFE